MTGSPQVGNRASGTILGLIPREWALIGVTLALATLPAVMPVMVGALTRQFGIRIDQAGYAISANMLGIMAGTLCRPFVPRGVADRAVLVCGLLVMVVGNLATMATHAYAGLLATRLLSGWGEGLAVAVGYALMARSSAPARVIAFYVGGQSLIGAVGMALLPSMMARYGSAAFYGPITLIALASLLAVRAATAGAAAPPPAAGYRVRGARIEGGSVVMLAAIFLYFCGMAVVWAFLERIGVVHGLRPLSVSLALSASSIANLAGALGVGVLSSRIETRASLVAGVAFLLVAAAGLAAPWPAAFVPAICLLSFTWAAQYPFLFRRLAEVDPESRIAGLTPVATGGALSVGPAVGGALLQREGVGSLDIAFLTLTLVGVALTAATYLSRRQALEQAPATAA